MESGGETFVVEADEIVLSSGSIGSPHILLLSGVGPADQLGRGGHYAGSRTAGGWGRACVTIPSSSFRSERRKNTSWTPTLRGCRLVARWTSTGSPYRNDLQILMSSMINPDFYPMSEGRPVTGLGMYTFINLEEERGEN